MRRSSLLLAALLSLAFAPAPFPRPGKRDTSESDLKKMQGAWVRVKNTFHGRSQEANDTPVTITGMRMQFPAASDAWTITLDATKKPKTIDLKHIDGDGP